MRRIRLTVAALLALVAITGAAAAAVAATGRPLVEDLAVAVAVSAYALVGLAVEAARPGHLVGRLMVSGSLAWGIGEALIALAAAGLADGPAREVVVLVGVLGTASRGLGWLLLILMLPLVFPDGRMPGRGSTWLVAGCITAFTLGSLVAPVPLEERLSGTTNPWGVPAPWGVVADLLALGAVAAAFATLAVAVTFLVRRWRAGGDLLRQQIAVFAAAFAVPLVLLPLVATPWARPWMFALASVPVPAAVGVAMLQRRLYDVQDAARRSLTFLALSAVLAALYALVVGGIGVMLRDRATPWLPWVAAGVVAVAFAPVRESLQRGVTRLTYGRWSTPAEVLADTGRRLADAADGLVLLDALTTELVEGLGLDRAEILDGSGRTLVSSGAGSGACERLDLTAYGGRVGTLLWAGGPLRAADRRLLQDLAHQVGGAVHTVALVSSLHRAREELVLAREQERRRLRNDLHDGLGPALAGLGLEVDAVANLLAAGADPAEEVRRLREGLRQTVVEVRRVVEGLRPPAIDDLGLFGAVAELGRQLAGDAGLEVTLDLPEDRPTLPAAVEVAAYRVTQEALTNVVRHASARTCLISGRLADGVVMIAVADDGVGGACPGRGVGMTSMRERAGEIGGELEIGSREPGTTVTLRLPLPAAAT